jgi:hypothetical protein
MTLTPGGRSAGKGSVFCGGEELIRTKSFKCLGITLQTMGKSFRLHIKNGARAASVTMHNINSILLLSMQTASTLFRGKMRPIMGYGLDLVWELLNAKDSITLENVKATFLKRMTQVRAHKSDA